MYFICNFSIKALDCVVFDPDCLKRSYLVSHTFESVDKVVKCYVRIMTDIGKNRMTEFEAHSNIFL